MNNVLSILLALANSPLPFSDYLIQQEGDYRIKTPRGWQVVQELDGEMLEMPSVNDLHDLLTEIHGDWAEEFKEKRSFNRAVDLSNWRLRVNAYLANGKVMMAVRRIPMEVPSIEKLDLPPQLRVLETARSGLILMGGATGSGKSTTMAALLHMYNQIWPAHIVTIEDPIEYLHQYNKAVFSQREVGVDTIDFPTGVKDAMRQRPDIIAIGEIRDTASAEAALLAAESGHLVIASIHSSSAPGSLQKLLSFFPDNQRVAKQQALSTNVAAIINQILVPHQDTNGYALAAEMLFNQDQQFRDLIAGENFLLTLQANLSGKNKCAISQSMVDAMDILVKTGKVSKTDAIRATVIDQQVLKERLK